MDKALESKIRSLTRSELLEVASLLEGLLSGEAEPPEVVFRQDRIVIESHKAKGVTLQLEKIRCGKAGCQKCPHGPYWYAYYRERGRLRSRYIGKLRATAFSFAEQVSARGQGVGGKDFLCNAEGTEHTPSVT